MKKIVLFMLFVAVFLVVPLEQAFATTARTVTSTRNVTTTYSRTGNALTVNKDITGTRTVTNMMGNTKTYNFNRDITFVRYIPPRYP